MCPADVFHNTLYSILVVFDPLHYGYHFNSIHFPFNLITVTATLNLFFEILISNHEDQFISVTFHNIGLFFLLIKTISEKCIL